MSSPTARYAVVALLCGASACKPETLDLENLPCDAGACAEGFVCNPISNVCVKQISIGCTDDTQLCPDDVNPGDSCPFENAFIPCSSAGDPSCTHGCYVCEAGVWSDCRGGSTECSPSTTTCNGSQLVACDANGNIDQAASTDCGALGCNETTGTATCNQCTPGTRACNDLVLELCGDDGVFAPLEDCATANSCSNVGTCDPVAGCTTGTAPDGTPCDDGAGQDGDWCNSACVSSVCTAGAAVTACDDGNICTDDTCDPATGCSYSPNTAPCDDGEICTTNDTCEAGACASGPVDPCDDDNVCTTDSCTPGVGCVNAANAGTCDDNDPCTTVDTCSGGRCVGSDIDPCDDGNSCTDDACQAGVGCQNSNNTASCDDGDACTTVDVCSGGSCSGSTPPDCDDSNTCTDDSCDSDTGCVNTNNTAPCDDGDACTDPDICAAGSCAPGPAPICAQGSDCSGVDSCDPAGADGNCDILGGPTNEAGACTDCAAGTCSACYGGSCHADECDGSGTAAGCLTDTDCQATAECVGVAGDCLSVACLGVSYTGTEQQACADVAAGATWGAGQPCEAVTCTSSDGTTHGEAVGNDCSVFDALGGWATVSIHYVFNTLSADGTAFNVWMRNIADASWDFGEWYGCTLTGVTGVGTYTFAFVENDLSGTGRHGTDCNGVTYASILCWMAADGDGNPFNAYQPVQLDQGRHDLDCTATMSNGDGGTEDAGFDGILFTTDLTFVPDTQDGPIACNDSDQEFAEDCSTNNWGPPRPPTPVPGNCSDIEPEADGTPCSIGGDTCCLSLCTTGDPGPGSCP